MGEVGDIEGSAVEALKHARSSNTKGIAAVLIALAGLVTAFGAVLHKPPEDAARAGYLELTKAILDVQAVEKQNHDDLEALREYVRGYTREHDVVTTPLAPASSSPAAPMVPVAKPVVVHASAPASASPPPIIAPLRPPAVPRNFDHL
jgi:hypothetical protein